MLIWTARISKKTKAVLAVILAGILLAAVILLAGRSGAGGTASEKSVGEAQLVNASAASSAADSTSSDASSAAASSSADSGSASLPPAEGKTPEEYFSEVRLARQKARDEAVELLEDVLQDAQASEDAKKEAVAQAAVIAQNVLQENNIESLVKAKGFPDCVAFLQNGECSVVVQTSESSQNNAIVIKDIVSGQSGVEGDKIKIIECG